MHIYYHMCSKADWKVLSSPGNCLGGRHGRGCNFDALVTSPLLLTPTVQPHQYVSRYCIHCQKSLATNPLLITVYPLCIAIITLYDIENSHDISPMSPMR